MLVESKKEFWKLKNSLEEVKTNFVEAVNEYGLQKMTYDVNHFAKAFIH